MYIERFCSRRSIELYPAAGQRDKIRTGAAADPGGSDEANNGSAEDHRGINRADDPEYHAGQY